jgi:hypothetical protein
MEISSNVFSDRESAVPPLASSLMVEPCSPDVATATSEEDRDGPIEPIAGFTCVIEYQDVQRLISCRRFKKRGDFGYVGAVCLAARGYREFRTDRIGCVIDPQTGEVLGNADYFSRFTIDEHRDAGPTWGLTSSRQATLVAGLNVLAFMAHCDGLWHPLETEPVERFVCSLWLRREWEGEPPLNDILMHAQRLSPDSDTFFKGVGHYARSETRATILRRAVADLIAADGVVCNEEFDWGQHFSAYLAERARNEGVHLSPGF